MAFRHFGGSVPPVRVAWTCPTCGDKQVGPLEDGCTTCTAGADARKAEQALALGGPKTDEGGDLNFLKWWDAHATEFQHADVYNIAKAAWEEAYHQAWYGKEAVPPARSVTIAAPTTGGYLLAMVTPESHESILTDQRTHATILAALAFYRDNQLAYGGLSGQLDAAEVSALITKLTPREEPAK